MRKRKAKPLGRSCSAVTPLSTWIWKCLKLHIVLHKSAFHPHETSESTHSPGTHRSLSFLNCYLGVFFFGSDASANSCRRLRLQLRPGPHQSSNPGKLKSLTNISNPHKIPTRWGCSGLDSPIVRNTFPIKLLVLFSVFFNGQACLYVNCPIRHL